MLRDHDGHPGLPRGLTDDELADAITTLAAHLGAAFCRWLELVADFDRRRVWAAWGCVSCAHWLAWRCSIAPATARDHVRVARRLQELPLIRSAFADGSLSYSKVRALTRLEDIDHEAAVVELGLVHTAAQLERVVRATRRVRRHEAARADETRFLVLAPDDDGSVAVRGRLTAEDAAVLGRALDLAREVLRDDGVPDDVTSANLAADALVLLADSVLVTGPAGRPTADRHEVVVHVDVDALAAPDASTAGTDDGAGAMNADPPAPHQPGRCATDDAVPLAAETARRLCCDAGIVAHLERGGEPLAVGRRTRTIPPAVRRALRARDGGCRFPGCTRTRWTDAHHVTHWADGGPTDLDNLVLLCAHHHRLVHEHGYTVTATVPGGSTPTAGDPRTRATSRFRGSAGQERRRRPGRAAPVLVFRRPDGRVISSAPGLPPGDVDAVIAGNLAAGAYPTAATVVPGWRGERLDLGCSVAAMLGQMRSPPDA